MKEERMPVTNENELIARAQAGDEQAFAELIRAYNAYVYAIVIGIVNNPLDAEEVVQDIFVNVYRGLAQYEERKKFKSWVAEIARNCARNRLRKQQVDTVPIDEVNEQSSGTEDLPDQQLIRSEQRELIRRAMETLPQKDREIVHSYYLDGASYDELIRAHGLSYKAISVRLARAKQKLSKRLEHLLTGIFVTPATTLKQIYSGGLTVMKIGTAPKITLGAIGLVGLLFIGIGVHHILSSDVPENTPSSVQTEAPSEEVVKKDTNQETENRENQPQISDQDMEQIKGFFAQLEAEDAQSDGGTVQSPTESKAELATTDTDAASEDTEQSAEDVMNAYLDAYKNGDYEALLPLATGSAKAELEGLLRLLNGDGGFLQEAMDNVNIDDILNNIDKDAIPEGMSKAELADRAFQMMPQVMQGMTEMMQEMFSGAEIVSSEYVEEEFHFRVSIPMPKIEMPELPKTMKIDMPEMPEIPESIEHLVKMQKVDGAWRIYDTGGK
jgi:RNA polymerase sigma-70 factor (ECF subfamily)